MEVDYKYLHDALDRLEHTSIVAAFQYQFQAIQNLLVFLHPEIPDSYFASRFISGLQVDFQNFLIKFKPVTVLAAYKLALIYEESIYLDYFPEPDELLEENAIIDHTFDAHSVEAHSVEDPINSDNSVMLAGTQDFGWSSEEIASITSVSEGACDCHHNPAGLGIEKDDAGVWVENGYSDFIDSLTGSELKQGREDTKASAGGSVASQSAIQDTFHLNYKKHKKKLVADVMSKVLSTTNLNLTVDIIDTTHEGNSSFSWEPGPLFLSFGSVKAIDSTERRSFDPQAILRCLGKVKLFGYVYVQLLHGKLKHIFLLFYDDDDMLETMVELVVTYPRFIYNQLVTYAIDPGSYTYNILNASIKVVQGNHYQRPKERIRAATSGEWAKSQTTEWEICFPLDNFTMQDPRIAHGAVGISLMVKFFVISVDFVAMVEVAWAKVVTYITLQYCPLFSFKERTCNFNQPEIINGASYDVLQGMSILIDTGQGNLICTSIVFEPGGQVWHFLHNAQVYERKLGLDVQTEFLNLKLSKDNFEPQGDDKLLKKQHSRGSCRNFQKLQEFLLRETSLRKIWGISLIVSSAAVVFPIHDTTCVIDSRSVMSSPAVLQEDDFLAAYSISAHIYGRKHGNHFQLHWVFYMTINVMLYVILWTASDREFPSPTNMVWVKCISMFSSRNGRTWEAEMLVPIVFFDAKHNQNSVVDVVVKKSETYFKSEVMLNLNRWAVLHCLLEIFSELELSSVIIDDFVLWSFYVWRWHMTVCGGIKMSRDIARAALSLEYFYQAYPPKPALIYEVYVAYHVAALLWSIMQTKKILISYFYKLNSVSMNSRMLVCSSDFEASAGGISIWILFVAAKYMVPCQCVCLCAELVISGSTLMDSLWRITCIICVVSLPTHTSGCSCLFSIGIFGSKWSVSGGTLVELLLHISWSVNSVAFLWWSDWESGSFLRSYCFEFNVDNAHFSIHVSYSFLTARTSGGYIRIHGVVAVSTANCEFVCLCVRLVIGEGVLVNCLNRIAWNYVPVHYNCIMLSPITYFSFDPGISFKLPADLRLRTIAFIAVIEWIFTTSASIRIKGELVLPPVHSILNISAHQQREKGKKHFPTGTFDSLLVNASMQSASPFASLIFVTQNVVFLWLIAWLVNLPPCSYCPTLCCENPYSTPLFYSVFTTSMCSVSLWALFVAEMNIMDPLWSCLSIGLIDENLCIAWTFLVSSLLHQ